MFLADRISSYNRKRKWDLFLHEISPTSTTRVLDIGFSDKEYSPFDNYIEKHYPYPGMLTALGIDEPINFRKQYPKVNVKKYDGNLFPFEDKTFDVCWSNAVIEHVGNKKKQLNFINHRFSQNHLI